MKEIDGYVHICKLNSRFDVDIIIYSSNNILRHLKSGATCVLYLAADSDKFS